MRLNSILSVLPLVVAAFGLAAPQAAQADGYDMDCKLLLCLPAGFPGGCSDAFDHMIDRLRDGKSPVGTCAMAGGGDYDDYEIDYAFNSATSRDGWQCPEGTQLHHEANPADGYRHTVRVFCYESRDTIRLGDTRRTYYTGVTRPDRTDFTLDMTMNVAADAPYETGSMRFSTGRARDLRSDIHYR